MKGFCKLIPITAGEWGGLYMGHIFLSFHKKKLYMCVQCMDRVHIFMGTYTAGAFPLLQLEEYIRIFQIKILFFSMIFLSE